MEYFHLQLDFVAELPPLSLVIYHVTKASTGSTHCAEYTILHHSSPVDIEAKHFQVSHLEGDAVPTQLSLGNKHVQIWSSPKTGLLKVSGTAKRAKQQTHEDVFIIFMQIIRE